MYHIGLDNETDIEVIREVLYESEKHSEWTLSSDSIEKIYGNEVISIHTVDDFEDYRQLSRKAERTEGNGDLGDSPIVYNGRGSNPKT